MACLSNATNYPDNVSPKESECLSGSKRFLRKQLSASFTRLYYIYKHIYVRISDQKFSDFLVKFKFVNAEELKITVYMFVSLLKF